MKPVYHHYTKWEDFQSGMYNEIKEGRDERVNGAIELLTSDLFCFSYMMKVIDEWKIACEQTFTTGHNPKAFLGQCACFLFCGARDNETRMAWCKMTNKQRYEANSIANEVFLIWKDRYEEEHRNQCI